MVDDEDEDDERYDKVRIQNVVDGSVIEGHEDVKAYFERERQLLEAHGPTITFQLYRAKLDAKTLGELQGARLAEIVIAGGEVSGEDTVAAVKERLRGMFGELVGSEQLSLFFAGRPMHDAGLFYADHFMMLPAFVQVVAHAGDFADLLATLRRLSESAARSE